MAFITAAEEYFDLVGGSDLATHVIMSALSVQKLRGTPYNINDGSQWWTPLPLMWSVE